MFLKNIFSVIVVFCLCVLNVSIGFSAEHDFKEEKINLVWQPIIDNDNDLSAIEKITGVNVVSPSWFVIDNANGHIKNNADFLYARAVKEKGYKVWALVSNDFNGEMTHEWLNDEKARKYIIRQLVFYAQRYPIDGYNFDLENIYDKDKDNLSEFMEEATSALHKEGLIVSIDVTVSSNVENWSSCYDRERLGKIVDYLILMAYDEHGRLSPKAGSVASLSWVENGIKNIVKDVPAQKVILGIPLYMRLWEEDYQGKVTASTLTMKQADKLMKEKDKYPIWLKEEGQTYFAYREDGKIYRIWKEDINSLRLKVDLIKKYKLAGVASWRKGFETPDIWPMINRRLNK